MSSATNPGGLAQPPIPPTLKDIRMDTAKNMTMGDVRMETARGGGTTFNKKGTNLKLWEKELVDSPEVRRKATVAQLCTFQSRV